MGGKGPRLPPPISNSKRDSSAPSVKAAKTRTRVTQTAIRSRPPLLFPLTRALPGSKMAAATPILAIIADLRKYWASIPLNPMEKEAHQAVLQALSTLANDLFVMGLEEAVPTLQATTTTTTTTTPLPPPNTSSTIPLRRRPLHSSHLPSPLLNPEQKDEEDDDDLESESYSSSSDDADSSSSAADDPMLAEDSAEVPGGNAGSEATIHNLTLAAIDNYNRDALKQFGLELHKNA